jgi:two-component system alkaline phosphatase synthesis response regulator PhoP
MNDAFNFALPPAHLTLSAKAKDTKILIVDDEPAIRQLIAATLHARGYEEFIFSSNGRSVPALALKEQPHLIIMDVMMPGGNGLRALRALKESPATAGIPVILTSGFHFQTLGECSQNRPDGVLAKPFLPSHLLAKVESILEKPAPVQKLPEIRRPANGSRTQPVPV